MKRIVNPFLLVALLALLPCRLWGACAPDVNDGDSLQEAIDSAADTKICIGVGTYTGPFTLPNIFTLEGEELARTILKGSGSTAVITAGTSTTVKNLIVDGNGGIGVSAGNGTDVNLLNVVVKDATNGVDVASATVDIANAVFDGNTGAAVNAAADSSVTMQSSILSNNSTDLTITGTTFNYATNLTYHNDTANYPTDDATSILDEAPLFVDSGVNDFHLKSGSPAIDLSDPTLDLGAYGGSGRDQTPFPVAAPVADEPAALTLHVTWSKNEAYDIVGYKVYFDNDSPGAPYDGASNQGSSPVDIVGATEANLDGLVSNAVAPGTPQGVSLSPGNGALLVSWQPVAGATGYFVSWGETGGLALPEKVDVGNLTNYRITGLTNGVTYDVAVTAYSYTTYYLAVAAYNSFGIESDLINETAQPLSDRMEGSKSAVVSDYPEETAPFPILADENKCFIATAAWGSPLESHVAMLRRFRNHFLLTNAPGRELVALYYRLSPPLARFIRHHAKARAAVRTALVPVAAVAEWCLAPSVSPAFVAMLLFPGAAFLGLGFGSIKAGRNEKSAYRGIAGRVVLPGMGNFGAGGRGCAPLDHFVAGRVLVSGG